MIVIIVLYGFAEARLTTASKTTESLDPLVGRCLGFQSRAWNVQWLKSHIGGGAGCMTKA